MYTMLNLVKSGSLLGLHHQLRVRGQYESQLSSSHCTIQLHPTLQGILSLFCIHFPNSYNNFESLLNLAKFLWELRYTQRLAELHFAHFRISEATTIVTS